MRRSHVHAGPRVILLSSSIRKRVTSSIITCLRQRKSPAVWVYFRFQSFLSSYDADLSELEFSRIQALLLLRLASCQRRLHFAWRRITPFVYHFVEMLSSLMA